MYNTAHNVMYGYYLILSYTKLIIFLFASHYLFRMKRSMFAARAGAKKVYAVDYSSIADFCKQIVIDNGLDGTIEVIRGKMEDIELPVKVDVIISEWMVSFAALMQMLNICNYYDYLGILEFVVVRGGGGCGTCACTGGIWIFPAVVYF